jgi:hypothetical protein
MSAADEIQERTYGGWRRQRGLGLFGLTGPETVAVVVPLLGVVYGFGWIRSLFIPALVWLGLSVAGVSRLDGVPLWVVAHRELVLLISQLTHRGRFVSPLLTQNGDPGADPLPGFLAPTTTHQISPTSDPVDDYGVVWNSATRTATVTWTAHSPSPYLCDPTELDVWVTAWHQFLAGLGMVEQIKHATITVVTATEPGSAVVANLTPRLDPDAPDLARDVINQLVSREDQGTTTAQTLVSITFATDYGPAYYTQDRDLRLAEVNNQVAAIERDLRACGLSSLKIATSAELAGLLRGAVTPELRAEIADQLRAGDPAQLVWPYCGPTMSESRRDYYLHDSAITLGWVLGEAPRSTVTATVLHDILRPGRFPKRVSLVWTPTPQFKAADILESERTKSRTRHLLRNRSGADETARDVTDREAADEAAMAEARGSGLGDFTIVATETIQLPSYVDERSEEFDVLVRQACSEMETRARSSRLILRRATGFHDIALWTGVGAGVTVTDAGKLWG